MHIETHQISKTIGVLENRVRERFPNAGLVQVIGQLHLLSKQCPKRLAEISAVARWIQVLTGLIVTLCFGVIAFWLFKLGGSFKNENLSEYFQGIDALFNLLLLTGGAGYWFIRLANKYFQKRILLWLYELRELAHLVDLHQLAKDPRRLGTPKTRTASSPRVDLTALELAQYLDYCSEALSLTGKVALSYSKGIGDPVLLSTVDQLEDLTNGISRKIWQKRMILGATPN